MFKKLRNFIHRIFIQKYNLIYLPTRFPVEPEIKGDFNFIEFGGEEIYAIKENKGSILVANEIGLFVKQTKEVSWMGLIEGNVSVRAFEIISEHEIIASLYFNTQDSSTIAKTINYGKDWLSYRNGYDPFFNSIPTVIEKSYSKDNTIYVGGSTLRIVKTENKGVNWDIIYGSWESLGGLFFIKNIRNEIWAGGMTALFTPILIRSNNEGTEWKNLTVLDNTEAKANDIIEFNDLIMVSLSGNSAKSNVIRRSLDDGETWKTVFEGAGIYTFTHSASNPDIVYASGRNPEGRLFFLASNNFGDTWQTIEHPESPSNIYVNDMVAVTEGDQEVIYLGTNKGLYRFTVEGH